MGFLKRILGGDHRSGGHGGGHDGGHHGSRRGHDARDRDRHGWGRQAPAGDVEANAPLRRLACAGCGALNAADARFCAQRGNACSRCHSALAADARFCPSCGTQAG
ncbi:zinc ribbon domain-containing protein [Burkholderia pseudomultivorans]|uniref:Zinc-ribbon domain-containing protein n=1 Tax=Burkholderia pseudomultivorans TaxID=1207504 RepID=A0ABU2EDJ6_9BURK|nr:zinc ribbon domain-containing protein [Burkholderia pseudomultivorans]MDR8730365.1 hypothetical protein [Burkholderia pseudomultivorans]MDR8736450.1 hypothetical protein [Burkholderia pseudomultivorans]MDR8744766.1 hypothetical protein [Burkholderia pseudomultivorans]MDR8757976.1 hypothetical protein [Burkholderia pseudomultivorans]MDR8779396.1 hypothetical protein [Burkholderia pseudomultivorans]